MGVRLRIISVLVSLALLFSFRAQALELNGVAPFTELGNEIYLAGLFVDSRSSDIAELFSDARERKMEIRFSSDMSRRRWSNNWMQSIAINTSRDALVSAADELSQALSSFADNLSTGDQVEIHYIPGEGTDIRLNGTTLANDLGPGIFNLFLSSWIGSVPPSSNFRNALVGREDSTVLQDRFYFIEPTAARIAAVRGWVADDSETEPEPAAAEAAPEQEVEVPPAAVAETAPAEEPASGQPASGQPASGQPASTESPIEEPATEEPLLAAEPASEPEPQPDPAPAVEP
ncbi:MAG: chalcone isomerase family protein, partial [Bacteroidales bacterium]|nr:chalcone isomerase family protein [Bacteroidales bacterium]